MRGIITEIKKDIKKENEDEDEKIIQKEYK